MAGISDICSVGVDPDSENARSRYSAKVVKI